ncbi:Reverse transcriptase (RNA-dependent DNA polymerase) [Fragilaria crotonensis]|nr:Reverse transcriptase (RNA-dependent DNA polymerase) [Fragilaria crotonensis]
MKIIRRHNIKLHVAEKGRGITQNHRAETEIREIKTKWKARMRTNQVPSRLWDNGLVYISEIQSILARGPDQRPGVERLTGDTIDISEWLDFDFYDRVSYWDEKKMDMTDDQAKIGRGVHGDYRRLHWEGKFSFDQYVGKHQQAHNELLFLEEPVAETKKVTDFLASIRDPKLETAIQTCMGDEQKLTNFKLCQQYFKTIVENTKTRMKSPSGIREIAKVGIVKDKKRPSRRRKSNDDDKSPSGIAIHSGQYSAKDYNKLKPFEKAKVMQLREEAKKKEKKKKSEAQSVAAVTTQEYAPPDNGDPCSLQCWKTVWPRCPR